MLKDEPKVGIVVLNMNQAEDTIECLSSLKKLDYANFRAVLVDNGSPDECLERVLESHPKTTILRNRKNIGFAAACNRGMRYCLRRLRCDYVLLLNNDVAVDPAMVAQMVAAAEARPDAAAVGAKIYFYDKPNVIDHVGGVMDPTIAVGTHAGIFEEERGQYEEILEADYVTGAAMLIGADKIAAIGFLDEEYFNYFEDTDWCARAKAAGYTLLVNPRARLWHKISRAVGPLWTLYVDARNRPLYILKNFPENVPAFEGRYVDDVRKGIQNNVARGETLRAAAIWMGFEDFCLGNFGRGRIDAVRAMKADGPLPLDANGLRVLEAAGSLASQTFRRRILRQFRGGLRSWLAARTDLMETPGGFEREYTR